MCVCVWIDNVVALLITEECLISMIQNMLE